jgi:phosphatidylinositol glycan class U
MGESLESAHIQHLSLLGLTSEQIPTSDDKAKSQGSGRWGTGNTAALFYLLNPFTIAVCIGGSTSPIENMLTILALYGAIAG